MLCLRREELDRDIPNDSPVEIEHCSSNGVLLKPANDLGLLQIVVKEVGPRTVPASSIEIHLSWFTLGTPKEIPSPEEATIMDRHHGPTLSQLARPKGDLLPFAPAGMAHADPPPPHCPCCPSRRIWAPISGPQRSAMIRSLAS